jgi:hypothetical protein
MPLLLLLEEIGVPGEEGVVLFVVVGEASAAYDLSSLTDAAISSGMWSAPWRAIATSVNISASLFMVAELVVGGADAPPGP